MTLPRQILPGRFYLLTRRTTQRQFLLRPDKATNNNFVYCLGEAAQRFSIDIVFPQHMSNHHHTVFYDQYGNAIDFTEHFHKMLARSQNALRGRWENFWSSHPPSLVELVDREDVLKEVVYSATNPVKDLLVERVHQWPGVQALAALLHGRSLRAERPRHFFRANGPMPASVSLELVIPHQLGDRDVFLNEVRERVAGVEMKHRDERARTGARVLGRKNVLLQDWSDSPKTREPRRRLSPRIAAACPVRRQQTIRRNKEFEADYKVARLALLAGRPVPFPAGTYWLRRFACVPVDSTVPVDSKNN